jgi:hypothetical protein
MVSWPPSPKFPATCAPVRVLKQAVRKIDATQTVSSLLLLPPNFSPSHKLKILLNQKEIPFPSPLPHLIFLLLPYPTAFPSLITQPPYPSHSLVQLPITIIL